MPTDTKLKELIINELTEEQYKALTPNDDELYLTPDGSITKNENGSYVLDGNVDITGTTKLNSGFEPIYTFENTKIKLIDYGVINSTKDISGYLESSHLMYFWNKGTFQRFVGIGTYSVNSGIVSSVALYGFTYDKKNVIYSLLYNGTSTTIKDYIDTQAMKDYIIDNVKKYYRHNLEFIIPIDTGVYYNLIITSSIALKIDSIADLRIVLNIKSDTDVIITPVAKKDLSGTAVLKITNSLCQIGADNVVAVSDDVTTL